MSDPKPGLIERLLMRVFKHEDIRDQPVGNPQGNLYLRRFFLIKLKPKDTWRLYLHKFYKGDPDRHHHDHPWSFRSLILKGGYYEETAFKVKGAWSVGRIGRDRFIWRYRKWYGPGSFLYRPATWAHRVILHDGKPAWTLVLTGPKERSWGFHTEKGWCWWKNYSRGVCWCYDNPKERVKNAAS